MAEENGQLAALAPVGTGLGDDQLLAVAAAAERRIDAINKIKRLALKVTNARDWTDQGGNPYLQVSGGEKVGRLFGISWRLDEPAREDYDDGHFAYAIKGYFTMGTVTIEVIGTRSSKDPFFSKAKGRDLPPSEIDRNDVKKGAVTNCIGNGITRLLGIRNLTWQDLEEAGIKRESIGKVDYRAGSDDPLTAHTIPFGKHKGKSITDVSVTIDDLQYQVKAAEKSIADPERAKYRTKNEAYRDALTAEITRRPADASQAQDAAEAGGDPAQPTAQEIFEDLEATADLADYTRKWKAYLPILAGLGSKDKDRINALHARKQKELS